MENANRIPSLLPAHSIALGVSLEGKIWSDNTTPCKELHSNESKCGYFLKA